MKENNSFIYSYKQPQHCSYFQSQRAFNESVTNETVNEYNDIQIYHFLWQTNRLLRNKIWIFCDFVNQIWKEMQAFDSNTPKSVADGKKEEKCRKKCLYVDSFEWQSFGMWAETMPFTPERKTLQLDEIIFFNNRSPNNFLIPVNKNEMFRFPPPPPSESRFTMHTAQWAVC